MIAAQPCVRGMDNRYNTVKVRVWQKVFLEVFPDLHMTTEMEELLKLVDVERVSSTRDRSSIRIYIVSQRLIHKKNIYDLEKGIREQLFPGKKLTIKIVEKYRLSGQYTPQKLFQVNIRTVFLWNKALQYH